MAAKKPPFDGPVTRRCLRATGAGLTHRGTVRAGNEDAILVDPAGRVWAVADGMGGHRLGGYAADRVIDALETLPDLPDPAHALIAALDAADRRVAARARIEGAVIGATVVAAVIGGGQAVLAWAGDARAYLLRDGGLTQLTRDHSMVQEMVDAGQIRPEEARGHPQSNIVTRAIGIGARPELASTFLRPGDRLLLCSDGLTEVLDDAALAQTLLATRPGIALATGTPADAACAMLLQAALAGQARDNVSVILIDLEAA